MRLTSLFTVLIGGCIIHAEPFPPPAPDNPPPGPPAAAPGPGGDVVSAKEIHAGRIFARVIYAKEVRARGGHVGQVVQGHGDHWQHGRGNGEIRVPELRADTIYAKEISADWIEAAEIHAKEVRIGR